MSKVHSREAGPVWIWLTPTWYGLYPQHQMFTKILGNRNLFWVLVINHVEILKRTLGWKKIKLFVYKSVQVIDVYDMSKVSKYTTNWLNNPIKRDELWQDNKGLLNLTPYFGPFFGHCYVYCLLNFTSSHMLYCLVNLQSKNCHNGFKLRFNKITRFFSYPRYSATISNLNLFALDWW